MNTITITTEHAAAREKHRETWKAHPPFKDLRHKMPLALHFPLPEQPERVHADTKAARLEWWKWMGGEYATDADLHAALLRWWWTEKCWNEGSPFQTQGTVIGPGPVMLVQYEPAIMPAFGQPGEPESFREVGPATLVRAEVTRERQKRIERSWGGKKRRWTEPGAFRVTATITEASE